VIDEVRVQWPSGRETLLRKQAADRLLVIAEVGSAKSPSAPPRQQPLFKEESANARSHMET
jgi:hypothetical protein